MAELAEMLSESTLAALKRVVSEEPLVYVVDEEEFPTTTINGVVVDMRGDAMHETACFDCKEPLMVEIAPKGVEVIGVMREATCLPCGKARVSNGATPAKVVKPRVAKHKPRLTDGIDHPVEVKHIEQKEVDMTFDFSPYSPAQLAQFIADAQDVQRAKIEAGLPAKVAAAVSDKKEAERHDKAQMEAERKERQGVVLAGFTIGKIEVPALDLSAVASMDDIASATVRSPYNKALFAMGAPIMAGGSTDDIGAKANLATYRLVAQVHERLSQPDAAKALKVAKKAKKVAKGKKVTDVVVASFEPEKPAISEQAQALITAAAVIGKTLSPAKAEQIAASLV